MSEYYPRTIVGIKQYGTFSKTTPLGEEPCPEAILGQFKKAFDLVREGNEALPARPVRAMKRLFKAAVISGNLMVSIEIHKVKFPEGTTAKIKRLHDVAVQGMGRAAKILITKKILGHGARPLGFSNIPGKIYS